MYSVPDGWLSQRGLPHSEISGSQPVSGSPKLFAAVHVLLRLSSPRHPPCALRSLTVTPKARHFTTVRLPAEGKLRLLASTPALASHELRIFTRSALDAYTFHTAYKPTDLGGLVTFGVKRMLVVRSEAV